MPLKTKQTFDASQNSSEDTRGMPSLKPYEHINGLPVQASTSSMASLDFKSWLIYTMI